MRRSGCWPQRRPGRSTSSSAPGWTCCAPRPPTPRAAAARLRHCCCVPRRPSSRSIRGSRARPISTPGARRCSPGAWPRAGNLLDVSRAALAAARPADPLRPSDLLLDGFALLFTDGRAAAASVLDRAATGFAGNRGLDRGGAPLGMACDSGRRRRVGLRDLRRGRHPRRPARARFGCAGGAGGRRQCAGPSRRVGRRLRDGGRAGRRGRRGHGGDGHTGRALRRPRARRFAGSRGRGLHADRRHHQGGHGRGPGNRGPIRALGELGPPQRPRPVRGGAGRGPGGERRHARAVRLRLGAERAHRSRHQEREDRTGSRRSRATRGAHARHQHRLGGSASRRARGRC